MNTDTITRCLGITLTNTIPMRVDVSVYMGMNIYRKESGDE